MDEKHAEIVIIKRHASHEEEHHGGAWKIAFADFMTAMMAFFLVLWIINATDKDTKTIIARYFNPVKLEDQSRTRKGIQGAGVDADSAETSEADGETEVNNELSERETPLAVSSERRRTPRSSSGPTAASIDKEQALFADPYGNLDRIVSKGGRVNDATDFNEGIAGAAGKGATPGDGVREPFEPIPLEANTPKLIRRDIGERLRANGSMSDARQDIDAGENENAAASDSPNPARDTGERPSTPITQPENRKISEARLVEGRIRDLVSRLGALNAPDFSVRVVPEGMLISLMDNARVGMFAPGSAEPTMVTIRILDKISEAMKNQAGSLVVRGYTDARPFRSTVYDNSRLSTARAQMAYYMLVRGGVPEARIEHVEGYGARKPLSAADPRAPENRRIEVLLRPSDGDAR
jgi:chemotaxis protein MotB